VFTSADTPPSGDQGWGAPSSGVPTVGVEEEFTLLDPATGAVAPRAAAVIRDCDDTSVVAESMSFMVETRTPVCRTLPEVHEALRATRRRISEAALRHDVMVVASGLAPFGLPDPPSVTDDPRYHELARRFPFAMSTSGICACHVHVGVPSRQLGVEALLRLRRWLPALIALTANSPIWEGRDTGRASHRLMFAARWPTAVPAPPVASVEEYDDVVRGAVASGEALDPRSVYFMARLSPRYPTVEIRVADATLTADDTLAYAGLARALVAVAVDEAVRGRPAVPVPQATLRASCGAAARVGLGGTITDPYTGGRVGAWELVDLLVAQVRDRLRAHGDETAVLTALDRLRVVGGGADRQRRLFRSTPSPSSFVASLAATTTTDLARAGVA
jgi:carboxylate-amine ligase